MTEWRFYTVAEVDRSGSYRAQLWCGEDDDPPPDFERAWRERIDAAVQAQALRGGGTVVVGHDELP